MGGVELIIDCMTKHFHIPVIMQQGCWALKNLAYCDSMLFYILYIFISLYVNQMKIGEE